MRVYIGATADVELRGPDTEGGVPPCAALGIFISFRKLIYEIDNRWRGAAVNFVAAISEQNTGLQNRNALRDVTNLARRHSIRLEPGFTATIEIPPGRYALSTDDNVGWDLTSFRRGKIFIRAEGAKLVTDESFANKVIIDAVHSLGITGSLPTVIHPHEDAPALYGLQLGFGVKGRGVGGHNLQYVDVRGYFSGACIINQGSEGNYLPSMALFNWHDDADAYCLIEDSETRFPLVSNMALDLAHGHQTTKLLNHYPGASLHRQARDFSKMLSAPCLYIGAGDSLKMPNSYFVTATECIHIDSGPILDNLDFSGFHAENPERCAIRLLRDTAMRRCTFTTGTFRGRRFVDLNGHDLTIEDCILWSAAPVHPKYSLLG